LSLYSSILFSSLHLFAFVVSCITLSLYKFPLYVNVPFNFTVKLKSFPLNLSFITGSCTFPSTVLFTFITPFVAAILLTTLQSNTPVATDPSFNFPTIVLFSTFIIDVFPLFASVVLATLKFMFFVYTQFASLQFSPSCGQIPNSSILKYG